MDLHAFKITWVFPVAAHGFCLLGIAHPLPYANAVFRQQVRHGSAETPTSQNCNRLLFSHIQSVKTNLSGDVRIIRSARDRASARSAN
ncbi:hypothetical protein D3C72_2037810 [compost metagenome]